LIKSLGSSKNRYALFCQVREEAARGILVL